ncbi:AsmA-like C-terminal domain-containing protein [Emcibacter sp. SYSU 3D8]|uniref:YhdP family protein n=1 Tax=Emcibacter sp. SYSU 3D8 TaxID=3133969 RepID=UPI0031FEFD88
MLGPVEVDFLRPTMQRALAGQLDGFTVDFEHTVLVWGGWSRAIDLRITRVALKDRNGRPVVELPQLAVGFNAAKLFRGHPTPRRIEFFSPLVLLSRKADGSFILRHDDRAQEGSDVIEQLLKSMLEPPSDRNDLRRFSITDAVVDIDDLAGEEDWLVSGASLDVRRTAKGLGATLVGTLAGTERKTGFKLRGDFDGATKRAALSLDITGAVPSMFSRPEGALVVLRGWNLPVSGRVTANAKSDGHVERLDFDLTAAKGRLTVPALAAPFNVDSAILKGNLDRASGRLTLDPMRLMVGRAVIEGKGVAFTSAAGDGGTLDATLHQLPFRTLAAMWPPEFKTNTRSWIAKNIAAGVISKGQLTVDVQPVTPGQPDQVDFGLDFEFDGLEAHYLRPMPPISRAKGSASLRPQFFELWVDEGVIADPANNLDVEVAALHGLIDHLDEKVVHEADILLALDTDVPQLLTLLDYKPLGYAKGFGVDPQTITGQMRGKVRFRIPLIKKLQMKDVTYEAALIAEQFLLTKGLEKLELQPGDLQLTLDRSGVVARGDFVMLGAPTVVEWTESFTDKSGTPTRYAARAALGPEAARKLGMPDVFEMDGTMDTTTVLVGKGSKISQGTVRADLKNASFAFPIMEWEKPAGEPGTLSMDMASQPGGLLPGKLSVSMPDLNTSGRLQFTPEGNFSAIELPSLQLGESDIALVLRASEDGPLDIDISGRKADIRPFLEGEDDGKDAARPETEEESTFAANVVLDVDEAILPKGVPIRDMDAVIAIARGEVIDAQVTGILKSGKSMSVDFQLTGAKPGIDVVTDDAGELLRTLGVLDGVTGGSMTISGAISGPRGKRHTVGTISAKDFRVKDSPMMAQMLTFGSLSGLRDTLTGDGIGFDRFDTEFDMGEGTLLLKDAKVFGSQLGIRVSGRLYDNQTRLDLDGTLAPAYTLNTVLDYVPIVGQIISGGENEGLIAIRFSVRGTTAEPDVSVNPLSALTPGFLRNMFNVFSTSPHERDKVTRPANAPSDPPAKGPPEDD